MSDKKEYWRLQKQKKRMIPGYNEQEALRMRSYRRKNPEKAMLAGAKKRAKAKGLGFDLVEQDIVIPDVCPILGLTLIYGAGAQSPNSPTLDRIDNTKGYIKNNIVVISRRANILKRDATLDELQKIWEFYNSLA